MALNRDDSMARKAIERALRVVRSRERAAPSNFDAPARWQSYQRDDVPWNSYDPYNNPWRKTPVGPGLGGSGGANNGGSSGGDDEDNTDAQKDVEARPSQGDFSGNDWMVPGLQQYAALNAALAQRGLIAAIAPTLERVGKPETWSTPEKTAPSRRGSDEEPAEPAAPRTSVSTPATRDEALDDVADLERTAQETEDMENAAVTRGIAMDFEPSMTAAQMAALSTLGREPAEEETTAPTEDEAPSVSEPAATAGLNTGLPSQFTGPNSNIAAQLANEEMAAIEESQARAIAAMEEQAANRTANFANPGLAQSLNSVREVSIPGFLAEELGKVFAPSMPSWAVNQAIDDFMNQPPAPEEFNVPAPAIEQALAASIASMTGRTPESVVANLPNVEESLAAAVEDEQAGVQAANMSMADIEESQAQALAAMQSLAMQQEIAQEMGLPGLSYAPQSPAFSSVETPSLAYNPMTPAFDVPAYTPATLPAVAQEEEPQNMNLYAPIETPAISYAPMPNAVMQAIYAEEQARAIELGKQMQEEVDRIGIELGREPTQAPSQSPAAPAAPGMIQGMINGLLGISPAYAGLQVGPQVAAQPGLMQQQITNPTYALDDFLGKEEPGWSGRVIGPMINNEMRSLTIDPYAFAPEEPATPEIDPQDIEPASVQNMSLTGPLSYAPAMVSVPAPTTQEEPNPEEPNPEEPAVTTEDMAPVSVENFSVVSLDDLDPATRSAIENAAMATARSMTSPTEVTVNEPNAYSIPGLTVSAPSSLASSLASLDYAQPAIMSVAMSQAQAEENDPASSFNSAFSDPAGFAATSLGFGMDGMFSAGLGVGFGPEGMTGQAPGQDPSAASSSFGGAGLGQSAAETSASQMSSLGLEGMFSSAFSNPSAFSGYGPSAAPSEEGVEGQEGVNGLEGGLGMDGIGASPTGAATGGEDGQGEGDTGDAGGAAGDGSGSAGDGGGSGGSGESGGGMGGDPGGAGTDSSNDGSGGISRDGGRITKPKWTAKERDRATAAIERALRVVKTRQTERDAKLKSKRKAKVA